MAKQQLKELTDWLDFIGKYHLKEMIIGEKFMIIYENIL